MIWMDRCWAVAPEDRSYTITPNTPRPIHSALQVLYILKFELIRLNDKFIAAQLGPNVIHCPNKRLDGSSGAPFKLYNMHWRDYSPQLLGPIVVTRHFKTENRSYASYGHNYTINFTRNFSLHFLFRSHQWWMPLEILLQSIPNEYCRRLQAKSRKYRTLRRLLRRYSSVS